MIEAKGGAGTIFKGISKKPLKNVAKGKTQFFIRMENPINNEFAEGYIQTANMGAIHKVVGKKGWIVTKFYEK